MTMTGYVLGLLIARNPDGNLPVLAYKPHINLIYTHTHPKITLINLLELLTNFNASIFEVLGGRFILRQAL